MSAVPSKPRRRLLGIRRADYDALCEALAAQVEARTQAEAARAAAEERDRAREARYAAALADAQTLAARLDDATVAIAQLVRAEQLDPAELASALQRLLSPRIAHVELLARAALPAELREPLAERDVATLWANQPSPAGEHALDRTAARAGERVVVARWASEVYDDGSLRALVERVCHAAAASLASRDLARSEHGRQPLSLLGGPQDAARFGALRAAQDASPERVLVRLRAGATQRFTGLYGEPAWEGELFHLAQSLDVAARANGGEAFELDEGFACLVPHEHAARMRAVAQLLLEDSRVEADVVTA